MNSAAHTKSQESGWISFLKSMGKRQWTVLLLAGALLAVIAMPAGGGEREASAVSSSFLGEGRGEPALTQSEMEQNLESILSQVEGVGEVRVMLTRDPVREGIYGEAGTGGKVTGVLVAAAGGDDFSVVQNIREAVQALFQVEPHKIKVMKMK